MTIMIETNNPVRVIESDKILVRKKKYHFNYEVRLYYLKNRTIN